ncbi:AMP-binding protein [Actinomadura roseirufa]|uniref:AMP-binding protein n=1 Tax=Actinomadura roseirufa TaxID=2094049 RepID=UPI001F5E820C|nr:AMP-binding protein [Actinomadura roseirufa]
MSGHGGEHGPGGGGFGLHGWFLRGLGLAEGRPAVQAGTETLTYGQAHQTALTWAGSLCAALGGRPAAVGILAGRSVTGYLGVLAGLYAGAAVVPLNPDFPAARNRAALAAAGAAALIVDDAGAAALAASPVPVPNTLPILNTAPLLETGAVPGSRLVPVRPAEAAEEPAKAAAGDDAYILFTSGSTGRPKGVPITHGGADAYFGHVAERHGIGTGDVVSQTFDLSFDCAIFDLFAAWGGGARLLAVPPGALRDLPGFAAEHGLTTWFSTPGVISLVRRAGGLRAGALPGLRRALFAGEALRAVDAAAWQDAAPGAVVENLYGPTELTITVSGHRWSPGASPALAVNGIVPIGRIHPGHDHLLLGPGGEPVAGEGEGELCVTGPQMTRGYLDPADDRGRFLEHASRRWFRTGDRVRRLPGGELAYLGRMDTQVQVHGLRVELGEIDHAARSCPGVEDAVTVAIDGGDTADLVLFHTGSPTPPRDLADALRGRLPDRMIPRRIHHVEALPANPNGKTDRRTLTRLAEGLAAAGPAGSHGGTVHGLLDRAATAAPDAPAVRDAAGRWTYAELDRHSRLVDAWLARRGIGRGDRVVVQSPGTRELVALYFGIVRRGATFVPINPGTKPFQLRQVLANADPRLVVVPAGTLGPIADAVAAPLLELGAAWEEITHAGPAAPGPGGAAKGAASAAVRPDDVAVLVYTSGSTASPKAVVCPHAQMTFATASIQAVLEYRPDDVVFCRFPISWDYGLYKVLLACLARCEIVLAGEESDLRLLERIRETGATVVPLVPSLAEMLVALAAREPARPASVRMFTNTGAALPRATAMALRAAFPGATVVRQFGQTECKRVSIVPPEREHERPGSVGPPLPGTRVLVLGPDGAPVPPGATGEIVAVGPHVMPGYWRLPELTARTFRRDEAGRARLHTGDYGRLDEDGHLYFEGRRDDMFKRKGIRMSTLEIENAALDVPGVRAAVAVPPGGDRDLALVVIGDAPPHLVLRELARRLEPAKVPARCEVVEELPLTAHGKYARLEVAAMLEGGVR